MIKRFPSLRAIGSAAVALAGLWVFAGPTLGSPPAAEVKADAAPVFDTAVDAGAQITEALKRARRDNTRVLLHYGGNWCTKCLALHTMLTGDEAVSAIVKAEYEYILVDYGQPPGKNSPLVKQYNADPHGDGVPYLTVLDSAGRMFANQPMAMFELAPEPGPAAGTARYDREALLKFLKANQAAPIAAQTVLDRGLTEARKSDRRVFLSFGAPWCGWCRRLDAWLARADIAPVLGKELVTVKVDIERNPGGAAMMKRLNGGKSAGIPWFVVLDGDGKPLADSFDAGGENVGFPAAPAEIEHFGRVLRKSAKAMTADEIDTVLATLRSKPAPAAGGGDGQ